VQITPEPERKDNMKADGKKRATAKPARKAQRAKGKEPAPPCRPINRHQIPYYEASHCVRIVAHAKTGTPVADYAGTIGVTPSTLFAWAHALEWKHEHPDFSKALELARSVSGDRSSH
jgi:hypothetical protein